MHIHTAVIGNICSAIHAALLKVMLIYLAKRIPFWQAATLLNSVEYTLYRKPSCKLDRNDLLHIPLLGSSFLYIITCSTANQLLSLPLVFMVLPFHGQCLYPPGNRLPFVSVEHHIYINYSCSMDRQTN